MLQRHSAGVLLLSLLVSVLAPSPVSLAPQSPAVAVAQADLSPLIPMQPVSPTGSFATTAWPGGNLVVSHSNDFYLTSLFRAGSDWLWHALPDPMVYANKTALALSPNFEQDHIVVLGTDYGTDALRISLDGGYHWDSPIEPVTGPILSVVFSPDFAVDQTVFATRPWGDVRLLRSSDGGQHWQPVASLPRNSAIIQLVMSPYYQSDHNLLARFSDGTLWRSNNNGLNWVRADNNLGTEQGNPVHAAAIAPLGQGNVALVVATQEAAVISFDWGLTWYLIDWKTFRYIAVPPDFAQNLTIYGIEASSGRFLRSPDLGDTWAEPVPGQQLNWVAFGSKAGADYPAYVGGNYGLWGSFNGGQSWALVSQPPLAGFIEQLETSPSFELDGLAVALSVGEAGLYQYSRTTDGGRNWNQTPLPGAGNARLAFSPAFATDHRLLLTRGTHLYASTSLGDDWQEVSAALPYVPSLLALSPAYDTDQTLFIGNYGGGVYRSTTGGTAWTLVSNGVPAYVTDLAISPGYAADTTLFVSTYNTGLYRTTNGGQNWINLTSPKFSPDFRISLSPAYPTDHTLFVGANGISNGGAFRSSDGGNTWVDITHDALTSYVIGQSLSPHFADDHTLIMARAMGPVYLSEDAGETWFPLAGLPEHIPYSQNLPVRLVVDNGAVEPLAAVLGRVYIYQWPTLPALPAVIGTGLLTGTTGIVTFTVPLEAPHGATGHGWWSAEEGADWVTVLPISGTLPAQLVVQIDSSQVNGQRSAGLTLRRYLSQNEVDVTPMQVRAFWVTDQAWLPLVERQSQPPAVAAMTMMADATVSGLPGWLDRPPFVWAGGPVTGR